MYSIMLTIPDGVNAVVLDTDVANEIDDPFAIAHALLSPDRIKLEAIALAPFRRKNLSAQQSQSMNRELCDRTLIAMGRQDIPVIEGAHAFMTSTSDIVDSEAVQCIIQEAEKHDRLFLLAIGAATNIASFILQRPDLKSKVTILWLGGHTPDYPDQTEYNLMGDVYASQVLLNSGFPLIRFPALGVTSHLYVSLAGLERDIEQANPLGKLLTDLVRGYHPDHFGWEKEMWDVGVSAYMVNPKWFSTVLEPTPGVTDDGYGIHRPNALAGLRVAYCQRNAIMGDLLRKIVDM